MREIECNTLDNLLMKYAPRISVFDFLSLDVEGAELSVLESINYDRVQFGIVFVEADEHNQMKNFAMRRFLESKGCTFLLIMQGAIGSLMTISMRFIRDLFINNWNGPKY